MMNTVRRLVNPRLQKLLGTVPAVVAVVVELADDQSWPPLSHSHAILSRLDFDVVMLGKDKESGEVCVTYPRNSSTIIMIARRAAMTIMKGQRNLQTRVQMYDRCKIEMKIEVSA